MGFRFRGHLPCPSCTKCLGTTCHLFLLFLWTVKAALVMLSQGLRGREIKIVCIMGLSEVVKPSSDTTASKAWVSKGAKRPCARPGASGISGGGAAGRGWPGGVSITVLPSATFRDQPQGQRPLLAAHLRSFLPFPLLCFFLLVSWDCEKAWSWHLFSNADWRSSICWVPLTPPSLPPQASVFLRFKIRHKEDGLEREEARDKESTTLPWALGT